MSKLENNLYVIYLGVRNVDENDLEYFKKQIASRIIPESINGEFIIIPRDSTETTIECINPVYVTEEILIKEHNELMNELNSELKHQISEIKKQNEEK